MVLKYDKERGGQIHGQKKNMDSVENEVRGQT